MRLDLITLDISNFGPTVTLTVIVQVVPSSPQADNQGGQINVFLTQRGHCGKEGPGKAYSSESF